MYTRWALRHWWVCNQLTWDILKILILNPPGIAWTQTTDFQRNQMLTPFNHHTQWKHCPLLWLDVHCGVNGTASSLDTTPSNNHMVRENITPKCLPASFWYLLVHETGSLQKGLAQNYHGHQVTPALYHFHPRGIKQYLLFHQERQQQQQNINGHKKQKQLCRHTICLVALQQDYFLTSTLWNTDLLQQRDCPHDSAYRRVSSSCKLRTKGHIT